MAISVKPVQVTMESSYPPAEDTVTTQEWYWLASAGTARAWGETQREAIVNILNLIETSVPTEKVEKKS